MNNKDKTKFLFKLTFCLALLLIVFLVLPRYSSKSFAAEQDTSIGYCYLSDMNWESESKAHSLLKDKTSSGSKISVKIEGTYYAFDKGIWAHAASTVIYDLTATPSGEKYDYFTAYLGLNQTAATTSNGVIFKIYTSEDGKNWSIKYNEASKVCKPGDNADFVKIDISEAKFLKLEAGHNGGNGNDHSVYADAKLIKKTYTEPGQDLVPSIEDLDERIKTEFANADLSTNKEYELTLLKRELISRAGKYALGKFLSESEENRETFKWLTNDVETLRLYLVGGLPEGGSYLNSLNVLTKLYTAHKEDLLDETVIEISRTIRQETTTLGSLYRKMMLSISLTHSGKVYLWITGANVSNPVTRYEIYKKLYSEKLIDTETFQSLTVEEMRWVMNTIIDDEEIEWLNWYVRENRKGNTDPYNYIKYTSGYNYWQAKYWDKSINKEQIEAWEQSYGLSKFGIIPTRGNPKLWIVIREGAVCGGISKTGCCIWGAYKGLPNTCVSQPAHCAYLAYSQNANGYGMWSLGNDVSGWAQTGKTEHLNTRMPNDWGKGSYTSGYNASYILLAQVAQNEYKKYEKAEEILMLANVYSNDKEKLVQIYDKALEAEKMNFDAWLGKVNLYRSDNTKTDEDYYNLAEDIATTLTYYPRPMYDLLKLIEPKIQSPAYYAQFNMLRTKALTTASKATNSTMLQGNAAKQVANSLLGSYDKNVANFSFDGVNGGAITLGSKFEASEARWEYSLDGGETWIETSEKVNKLTSKELESITSTNDIKVHIIGVARSDKNIYTIDIQESAGLPSNLYANDLENRVVGIDLSMEWRYTEDDEWTLYSVASPDLTGDKTVQVRKSATGVRLPSSASGFYTFTQDNDDKGRRKYITISHLSINSYSTQSVDSKRPFYAPNAIDGNMNTLWHTDFKYDIRKQEAKPFITVELDAPKYISALEFAQIKYPGKPNDPDFVKNVIVYVSENGENWTEAGKIENCTDYNALREVTFTKSIYGKYVKLEMGKDDMFSSIAMINLFEDVTKVDNTKPTASVYYSPEEPTNQYVIARLVNPNKEITITNNDGKDTYVFTENGNFTFEFEDAEGNTGSVYAEVNWIKKDAPTADVEYKLSSDKKLSIILENISEDVYLLDKDNNRINYIEVEKQGESKKAKSITYLDSLGNAYKIAELNENGVIKSITYKNTTGEVSKVAEYVTIIEDGVVVSEEYYDSEDNIVIVTDAEKQTLGTLQQAISNPLECYLEQGGDYEFRLLDKASNIAYKSIKVDYINDSIIMASDITYDNTGLTNEEVIATINSYIIDISGKNASVEVISEGGTTHTFTENGEFTFKYRNILDTENKEVKEHRARVTWIDKTAPTAEARYSTTELTNRDVTVTLVNESEEIIITNNGGNTEYTFTENGEFTFEFEDKAGNKGTAVAKVDWIDKTALVAEIEYSTTELTNRNVVAKLVNESEEIIITNNGGNREYTFTGNGEFTFEFEDRAGNKGTAVARVDWIDKIAPKAEITYSKSEITNQDVLAIVAFDENNVVVTGEIEHTFTENGEFTFEFEDRAGNKGTAVAKVNWIDKTAPTAEVRYSKTEVTNQNVVATLVNASEEVIITNNGGNTEYTFTENGEFTFEFEDKAGNKGTAIAKIGWIDKTAPTAEVKYSKTETTNQNVVATLVNESEEVRITNNGGSREHTFTENGEFTFEFEDKAGNKGTAVAKVTWIEKKEEKPSEYKVGDINQDNKITATDLLLVKRHLVAGKKQEWILIGNKFNAGDINQDGKITATDLLLIKRLVLKEMKSH